MLINSGSQQLMIELWQQATDDKQWQSATDDRAVPVSN
jgi:hypothetical protein